MKEIPLTKGYVTIVDDEDYEELSKYKWHTHSKKDSTLVYAVRYDKGTTMRMHRQIMGLATHQKVCVDHINGNGLLNTKDNLRICTSSQNMRNRKTSKSNKSGFKGVVFKNNLWLAQIYCGKKQTTIGYYTNKIAAALSYNKKAEELHGEYARPNDLTGYILDDIDALQAVPGPHKYGYKGIYKNKDKFVAKVTVNGKVTRVGCIDTPEEAALVYDDLAKKAFGDKAQLNFP